MVWYAASAKTAVSIPMKALVTGFEPFADDLVNPSAEALQRLPPRIGEVTVATWVLPTVFDRALNVLGEAVVAAAPDIVLGVGLAGGRAALSLERVAINVNDARIPDNAGRQPIDRPIVADGPAAYFASLPIKAAVAAMRQAGLPAMVSNTAGTFVCNHVFYGLMHLAAIRHPGMRGGFLHVPYLPEQAARNANSLGDAPSMALDDIVRGIEIVLAVAAARQDDIVAAEGMIS
jgi:pyroglutamyl-peptidase